MSRRTAAWLAWSLCAAALALFALALLLIFLGWSTPLPKGWVLWQGQIISTVGFIGAPVLGGASRLTPTREPLRLVVARLGSERGSLLGAGWGLGVTLLPFLLLLFPTGRLPSRRWRPVVWMVLAAGAVLMISAPLAPGNSGIGPFENPWGVGGVVGG